MRPTISSGEKPTSAAAVSFTKVTVFSWSTVNIGSATARMTDSVQEVLFASLRSALRCTETSRKMPIAPRRLPAASRISEEVASVCTDRPPRVRIVCSSVPPSCPVLTSRSRPQPPWHSTQFISSRQVSLPTTSSRGCSVSRSPGSFMKVTTPSWSTTTIGSAIPRTMLSLRSSASLRLRIIVLKAPASWPISSPLFTGTATTACPSAAARRGPREPGDRAEHERLEQHEQRADDQQDDDRRPP